MGLDRRRLRISLLLLLPIVALTIALASTVRFRGAMSVDNRTYVEMATGVRAHGLPYTLNAYSQDFPEARPPFNVARHGKLWGNYTPLYPYAAAIALELGGLPGIARQNFVFLGVLALLVFGLGWRFTGDPLRGVAASYLTLFGSSVWASSTETFALPLVFVCITLAALLAVVTIEMPSRGWRSHALAVLTGFVAGLAVATHLLALLMALMLIAALAIVRAENQPPPGHGAHWRERWLPDRTGLVRAFAASLGLIVVLVPMGILNRHRFGTYNPITYGPCEWARCFDGVQSSLHAGGLLAFALPGLVYFLVLGILIYRLRTRPRAIGLVLAVAVVLVALPTPLRDSALRMLRTVYGYAFDTASLDFDPYSEDFADHFGHGRGQLVIKSLLQSSPVLLCGLLVPLARHGRGGRALVILAPVAGLFLSLALLGRFKGAFAFGWPHVLLRYTLPAAPLLAVLAVEALAGLSWRRTHFAMALAVAVVGIAAFVPDLDDHLLLRRVVILRVTLLFAVGAAVLLWLTRRDPKQKWRHAALVVAAGAVGLSATVSMGVDTRLLAHASTLLDARVQRLSELTPHRFALAGYGAQEDHALTLRAERDIAYIDLLEAPFSSLENFRLLVDLWTEDGRPIFAAFPDGENPPFKFPFDPADVPGERLDAKHEYWRVGPPANPLSKEQLAARRAMLEAQRAARQAASGERNARSSP